MEEQHFFLQSKSKRLMQNNLFFSNRFIKSFHLTFSIVPQLKKKNITYFKCYFGQ